MSNLKHVQLSRRKDTSGSRLDSPMTSAPLLPPNLALELPTLVLVHSLLAQSFNFLCLANHPCIRLCMLSRAGSAVSDIF